MKWLAAQGQEGLHRSQLLGRNNPKTHIQPKALFSSAALLSVLLASHSEIPLCLLSALKCDQR